MAHMRAAAQGTEVNRQSANIAVVSSLSSSSSSRARVGEYIIPSMQNQQPSIGLLRLIAGICPSRHGAPFRRFLRLCVRS